MNKMNERIFLLIKGRRQYNSALHDFCTNNLGWQPNVTPNSLNLIQTSIQRVLLTGEMFSCSAKLWPASLTN